MTIVRDETAIALPPFEGDWKKNTVYNFKTLQLVIEYLTGDRRTKIRKDGVEVSGIMPAAYGRVLHTTDRHGEGLDMYLSSEMDLSAPIYIIDQICLDNGQFDEHKLMLGFPSMDDAITTYCDVFGDKLGGKRLGAISSFSDVAFALWLDTEGNTHQPASKFIDPDVMSKRIAGIALPRPGTGPNYIDEAGGVAINLPSLREGPKLLVTANEDGGRTYTMHLFSGIGTEVWSNFFDLAVRTLDMASENDSFDIYIASPGGSVFLMGRLVSAIRATKALVTTYAQGSVASAATAIWAEGHVRHILPGAFFMQHMSSQFMAGKTTDISAKTTFCMEYIARQLAKLEEIHLFTGEEVRDMIDKSADIFISGREAKSRLQGVDVSVTHLDQKSEAGLEALGVELSQANGWGSEFVTPIENPFGMESFHLEQYTPQALTQAAVTVPEAPWFNPVNIVSKNGVFYASIYICRLSDDMRLTQSLAVWLGSLLPTDRVRLSVAATVTGIPFSCLMTLLSAIANTKAKIEIVLDQIVMDGLAYFYLLSDQIIARHAGGLFIQSYVDQRREDTSATWKAVHDFYQWIVEDAAARGILTSEEAERLNSGSHVIVPIDRFSTQR